MRSAIFVLLALLFVSPAQAFFEDFDDDTAGNDPSGAGYTYTESGVVAAQQVSAAQALSLPNSFVLNEVGHAVDFQSATDMCLDGWGFEWDFYFDATLPTAGVIGMGLQSQSVFTVPGATDGQVGRNDPQNLAVLLLVTATTGDFDLFYRDGAFSETLEIPSFGAAITDTWYHATLTLDDCDGSNGGAFDYTLTLEDGHLGAPVSQARIQNVANVGAFSIDFFVAGDQTGTGDANDALFLDNLCINFFCDGVAPPTPTKPEGVSAIVTEAQTGPAPDEATVELRWTVSSNDPDQDQGDFAYELYVDGINVGDDATTAADGEGVRFHSFSLGATGSGRPFTFQVKARNITTGLVSTFSCAVTVDTSILGDRAACGSGAPGGGSGLDFTTPSDTAAGLAQFCADLMGDSEASKFLCGLILVVIVFLGVGAAFAAMAGAPGMPAVIAGSVAAFGMMIFLVVAQIWSLGAAAVIILLATGVALALMRRLFFGGGSGS